MRVLTFRERRLVGFLGLAVFLAANLFGLRWLKQRRGDLARELVQLRIKHRESRAWLDQRELWQPRQQWLDQHQPRLSGPDQETGVFLGQLQQGARDHGVVIAEQRLADPLKGPAGQGISVELEVHGPLEAMTRWLASLQGPESFQAITRLTLKSDAEPPKVICTLTLVRWYAPQS